MYNSTIHFEWSAGHKGGSCRLTVWMATDFEEVCKSGDVGKACGQRLWYQHRGGIFSRCGQEREEWFSMSENEMGSFREKRRTMAGAVRIGASTGMMTVVAD